jgi:phenylpropionate dioxygenase-like ring-hydroxylating dioxygenase large terminal subunit
MNQQEIQTLRELMEYEAARTEPPESFPALPDLPAGRYTDPRFFELEQKHIWRKAWLLAAHIDELPDTGCFRLWENAGQPVVLVNAGDGKVNAFYNTCRHRGAPIVTEESGQRPRLVCKYHGWTYSHQGELLAIRDPEDFRDLDFSCRSLISIRCERFGNLVFVNFDDNAPSLLDWLGPVADEWKEFQFDRCRLAGKHIFDLNCNWKIAMEANTEVYHVRSIHPKTVAVSLDDRRNVNTLYRNGHGRMVAPTRKGMDTLRSLTMDASNVRIIETVGEIGRTCTQSYGVFPNWVSPLSHRSLPPLLFWPNGINRSKLETWTLVPDWGDGPKPVLQDMWTNEDGSSLGLVLLEDTEFGAWIQKSMESYGFKGVPLSYQEARIYHWNQWADRLIGIENIPPELRVAQVIGDEWLYPNDPRVAEMRREQAQSAG